MKLLTCDTCGTAYRPDATPDGLCPTCLLARGADEATRPPGTGPSDPRRAPPPIDELAPHFPQLELLEVVGRGGMGAVYKARQKELGRVVALKILPGDVGDDPDFAERFRREARALASLSHAGIVAVHDFGNAGGWWWFLMEFVDGATLRGLLADGPVEPSLALSIVRQVCDALEYAHGRGVVHRDVKPENILVDRDGRVKLVDFGLARLVGGDARDLTLTYTGQRMGTPHYMAPEQWERPGDVDHRADIYALGVVFYELLTGELPVGRFRPPSEAIGVPDDVDRIVLKALERDRERRYQQTSEMSTDCETARPGKGVARRAAKAATKAKPTRAASSTWLPEARGWGPWLAKTFWMLGSASVLGGFATLLAVTSMLAGQQAVSDWRGAAGVSGAFGVSIAAVLIGFAVAVLARSRSHTLDRRAADGASGEPRPWIARRWLVPLTLLVGAVMTTFAVEETSHLLWDVPAPGVFEFGVMLLVLGGFAALTRLAWFILPARLGRTAPVALFGAFALLITLAIMTERHDELRGAVAEHAVLYGDDGRPAWTAPTVDAKVIHALARKRGMFLTGVPDDAWISAEFNPRSFVSRSEPSLVSWEVEVREPPLVADDVLVVVTASVEEARTAEEEAASWENVRSEIRDLAVVSTSFTQMPPPTASSVTVIALGDDARTHRRTITLDLSQFATEFPDDPRLTLRPRLRVHVCRPPHGLRMQRDLDDAGRFLTFAGGAYWDVGDFGANDFTALVFDSYPADHPSAVTDATVDLDAVGWRLLGRRTVHENVSDGGVDTQRAFDGMLRFGSVFDPPVPFAAEYDVYPTDAWDGAPTDEPFGSGSVVMMPGQVVTFPGPDGSVPAPTDVGVSTELIPAWSERPFPITFAQTDDDWRSRFADDVFNHRVDAVRLVFRPSREAALAAPYDLTEYWAADAIDVTVPLLR